MTASESAPLLVGLAGLFATAVFLAAAEAALLRVPRVRVAVRADEGDRRAGRLLRLLDDLPRVMNTILLIVLLAQIGAATVAGYLAERRFGNVGVTIASIGLTLVMFVYAEAIPKTVAVRSPLAVARLVVRPVAVLAFLLRPIVTALLAFADLQAPGRGIASPRGVTEAELRRLALEAAAEGHIEPTDLEFIERAFRAGDERVESIVVPRHSVVAVPAATGLRDAIDTALESGHRRLPVYDTDLDDVIGVIRLRDLARAITTRSESALTDLLTPVLAVPEGRRVVDALRDMQSSGQHLALVVDEHGGTTGIVTIEDAVGEVVGEIGDDRVSSPVIRQIGPGRWLVDGAADVDDLAAALDVDLPEGDWHTAAGLVLALAGKIPRVGETVSVEGHTIRVDAANRRRVRRLEVSRENPL